MYVSRAKETFSLFESGELAKAKFCAETAVLIVFAMRNLFRQTRDDSPSCSNVFFRGDGPIKIGPMGPRPGTSLASLMSLRDFQQAIILAGGAGTVRVTTG